MVTHDDLTVEQAAQALGLDPATIRRRLANGTMRGTKIAPRLWLIPRDEVAKWIGRGELPRGRKPKRAKQDGGAA